MSTSTERPVAFYHQDGLVPAWNNAVRFASTDGHVATLPEIIELRLGTEPGTQDSPWENWYTTSSAEYVGRGADGMLKIIVAHGVGPMATIDGIKQAYKWEWSDKKNRRRRGGRVTAQEFLDLEAGKYGEVNIVDVLDPSFYNPVPIVTAPVNVINFWEYLDIASNGRTGDAFSRYFDTLAASINPLLLMRLGSHAREYIRKHGEIARNYLQAERPNDRYDWSKDIDDQLFPYISLVDDASNCPYVEFDDKATKAHSRWQFKPREPEEGYAFGHLLSIDQLMVTSAHEIGTALMSSPGVHEWSNSAKFVAVTSNATLTNGVLNSPQASDVLRKYWTYYMQPVEEDNFVAVTPFRIEQAYDTWFTHYPKDVHDVPCMDSGDVEFLVRDIEQVGDLAQFTTNDAMFFLRYELSQVSRIAPYGANAYDIVDIKRINGAGDAIVTVRFYHADVDTSQRLPRADELARDYDRLMEVFTS